MPTWYEDQTLQTYTTTYESDQDLNEEIIAALDHGWLPERVDRVRPRNLRRGDRVSGSAWTVTWVRKNAS